MLLSGCKYGSYKEASDACKEWVKKGSKYYEYSGSSKKYYRDMRDCIKEEETKKVLGLEYINIDPGMNYKIKNYEREVKKRFKY